MRHDRCNKLTRSEQVETDLDRLIEKRHAPELPGGRVIPIG